MHLSFVTLMGKGAVFLFLTTQPFHTCTIFLCMSLTTIVCKKIVFIQENLNFLLKLERLQPVVNFMTNHYQLRY